MIGNALIIIIRKWKMEKNTSIVDHLFLIFETLCNQSSNVEIENTFIKMICILSGIMTVVIAASYGATLASYVAVEILQVPFTNIEEFVRNGQYKLLLYPNGMIDNFFNKVS